MSGSPRSGQTGVSLFPFLDVLLSTMGSLILMFAIITRTPLGPVIKSPHEAGSAVPKQDLQAERELLELRIAQLAQQRSKTQEDLRQRQLELGHLEDDAQKLRAQLDELVLAAQRMNTPDTLSTQQRAQMQFEIGRKQGLIGRKRMELEELRRLLANQPPSYAVVPYRGPNGTRRIPIYIECTDDAITIQPEGVELVETDFDGPLGPGNPLAAAIRAAREEMSRERHSSTGETGEPYPLLLVRPDGIQSYWVAREALQSWGADFGYEFIDGDWDLAYKEPDQEIADRVERAVEVAREQQRLLAQLTPRSFGSAGRAFRANPHGSGVIAEDGSYPPEGGYGAGHRRGTGRGRGRRRGGGNASGSGSTELAQAAGAGGPGINGPGGSGFGTKGQGGSGFGPDGPGGSGTRGAGIGGGIGSNPAVGAEGDGSGLYPPEASMTGGPAEQGGTGDGLGSEGTPGGTSGARASRGGTTSGGYGRGDSAEGSDTGGGSSTTPSANGGDAAEGSDDGSPGGGHQSGSSNRSRESGRPGGGASRSNGSSGGPSLGSSPLDTPGSAMGGGSSGQPGAGMNPFNIQYNGSPPPKSLAEKRGKDWGKPETARGASPVTRPIIVECRPNSLALMTDDGSRRPAQVIPLAEQTEVSIDPLVAAVWKHIDGWGIAGNGMYWHPVLVLDVDRGGEQRANDLQTLLTDSGIEVKRRAPAASAGPRAGSRWK